jgi:predicted TIM-barrel fold metal-dependent hydrolase
MVRICTGEYGFCGVKMNGCSHGRTWAQNHYYIDDPELALPVAEAIARTGKAIAFHIGPDEYERTHPFRAAKIARMFPETPVLMVHMGMTSVDMNNAVIQMARERPNMALIGSATTYKAILQAIKALGASRVCFGTDAPFQWPHVGRAMYDAVLNGEVTEEEKSLVMGGNIVRILGL